MKILAAKQRTEEWRTARCGRISASRIADVMNWLKGTKAEREAGVRNEGADRRNYRMELLAERLTAIPADHYKSPWMDFGNDHEAEARRAYELRAGLMADQVGFVQHPALDYAGASPDGLCGDDGGLEIKVPKTETHLGYLFASVVPEEYRPQMYFGMACCEREWWDFASYDPRLPEPINLFVCRLHWSDEENDRIMTEVQLFNRELEETIASLRQRFGEFKMPAQMRKIEQPVEETGFLDERDYQNLMHPLGGA